MRGEFCTLSLCGFTLPEDFIESVEHGLNLMLGWKDKIWWKGAQIPVWTGWDPRDVEDKGFAPALIHEVPRNYQHVIAKLLKTEIK